MNTVSIPSPLKQTLDEMAQQPSPRHLCIESADYALYASLYRVSTLAKQKKRNPVSAPSVVLLVDQDILPSVRDHYSTPNEFSATYVSENQSPKENLEVLHQHSKVLITTPSRIIDHIRRDNIRLDKCTDVIVLHSFVQREDEDDEQFQVRGQLFLDDCRFVFTKLDAATNIEYFCASLDHLQRSSKELYEDVNIVPLSSWYRSPYPVTNIICSSQSAKDIEDILYTIPGELLYIVHGSAISKHALLSRLSKAKPALHYRLYSCSDINSLQEDVDNLPITVVLLAVTVDQLTDLIRHLYHWNGTDHRIYTILKANEATTITTSKETLLMDQETKLSPSPEEITAGKLQLLTSKVKIDSNPEELENLKKLFKKNVPFTQRGNVTAYLLREFLNKNPRGTEKRKPQNTRKAPAEVKSDQNRDGAKPKTRVMPEGSRTLYINIGKMRRLYSKELSQIFQDNLSITKDDIYSIRVHDKYSFVTLDEKHAEKAIEVLNGMEIRGRIAAVSYSNKE
ncbi:MAG: DbpA RNA binding domain-containing protein [Sphaerochaetaceae bacterium]